MKFFDLMKTAALTVVQMKITYTLHKKGESEKGHCFVHRVFFKSMSIKSGLEWTGSAFLLYLNAQRTLYSMPHSPIHVLFSFLILKCFIANTDTLMDALESNLVFCKYPGYLLCRPEQQQNCQHSV